MTTAKRPLNWNAVDAADEELYAAHEGDPRPNALFDENGTRRKLHPTDPAQEALRQEWFDLYAKHGGEVEDPEKPPHTPPDDPVQPCPKEDELELVELIEECKTVKGIISVDPKVDRKQWVNLSHIHYGPGFARGLHLKARVRWKSGKTTDLEGHTVYFRTKPDPGNRSGLLPAIRHRAGTDDLTTATTDQAGWTHVPFIQLSGYGGDKFRVRATLDGSETGGIATGEFTVWRKVWYEIETMRARDGSRRPLLVNTRSIEKIMNPRFIEFVATGKDSHPPYKRIMPRGGSYVDDYVQGLRDDFEHRPYLRFLFCDLVGDELEHPKMRLSVRGVPKSGIIELVNGTQGHTLDPKYWVTRAEWKQFPGSWTPFPKSKLTLSEDPNKDWLWRILVDRTGVPGLNPKRRLKLKLRLRFIATLGGFQHRDTLVIATRHDDRNHILSKFKILHICLHEAAHAYGLSVAQRPDGVANPYYDGAYQGHCLYHTDQCALTSGTYKVNDYCPPCSDCLRGRSLRSLPNEHSDPY